MASLNEDSRALISATLDALDEEPSWAVAFSARQPLRRRRGQLAALGGALLLASAATLACVGVGGSLRRPLLRSPSSASAAVSLGEDGPILASLPPPYEGPSPRLRFEIQEKDLACDNATQRLADLLKDAAVAQLNQQGWQHIDLGPYKGISYCRQSSPGCQKEIKVQIGDSDKLLQLQTWQADHGEVEGGKPVPPQLLSARVVAASDRNCLALPLPPPPPPLPHVIREADQHVQHLCDAVKNDVPLMLLFSGWEIDLGEYKAISFCSDGIDFNIKVEVNNSHAKDKQLFLQLLVREGWGLKGQETPQLMSALMVTPVAGSCASLPALPPRVPNPVPTWLEQEEAALAGAPGPVISVGAANATPPVPSLPDLTMPAAVTLPPIELPKMPALELPSPPPLQAVTLPPMAKIEAPTLSPLGPPQKVLERLGPKDTDIPFTLDSPVPNLTLPTWTLPNWTLPNWTLNSSLSNVTLPNLTLPNLTKLLSNSSAVPSVFPVPVPNITFTMPSLDLPAPPTLPPPPLMLPGVHVITPPPLATLPPPITVTLSPIEMPDVTLPPIEMPGLTFTISPIELGEASTTTQPEFEQVGGGEIPKSEEEVLPEPTNITQTPVKDSAIPILPSVEPGKQEEESPIPSVNLTGDLSVLLGNLTAIPNLTAVARNSSRATLAFANRTLEALEVSVARGGPEG